MHDNQPRSFFEKLIAVARIKFHSATSFTVFINILRQHKGRWITTLTSDKLRYLLYFRCVYKGALDTCLITSCCQEHIPTTDQFVSTSGVQDGPGIDFRQNPNR